MKKKKNKKSSQHFSYHLHIILVLCGILATYQFVNTALGREKGEEGGSQGTTYVTVEWGTQFLC